MGDVHLDRPLPRLATARYRGARLLAWLHGRPVAEAGFTVPAGLDDPSAGPGTAAGSPGTAASPDGADPLSAGMLADLLWPLVADRVREHCAADGLPVPEGLTPDGLAFAPAPAPASAPASAAGDNGNTGRVPACRAGFPVPETTLPVTVLIATRNRAGSLLRCLGSLARSSYRSFDVVIIDSAPDDDSTERALGAHGPWPFPLRYVRVSQPGLALAHNAGLAVATGEVVAITDDDVQVDPGWLTAIVSAFAATGAACVTGMIAPAELETEAQLLVERSGGYGRGLDRREFSMRKPGSGPLFPFTAGRFGSGANMAFRTGWFRDRGGFDSATGAGSPARGGDDLTAFLRVITEGGTLVYEPAAVVRHWHRREYSGMRRQAFGYGVGLGAYLTASVWSRPALLPAMLRRAAPAVAHLVGPGSAKNEGRGDGFPQELVWRERAGVLTGPFAYAVSRFRYRDPARWYPGT